MWFGGSGGWFGSWNGDGVDYDRNQYQDSVDLVPDVVVSVVGDCVMGVVVELVLVEWVVGVGGVVVGVGGGWNDDDQVVDGVGLVQMQVAVVNMTMWYCALHLDRFGSCRREWGVL